MITVCRRQRRKANQAVSGAPVVHVTLTTASLSKALTAMPSLTFSRARTGRTPVIEVDDAVRYQQVHGFGAAMTDSSAWLLETQLSPSARTATMTSLFSTQGIHLSFLRVPMGASDFTATGTPYTYDDMPAGQTDPTLAHFSIAHDEAYVLPALRQALGADPGLEILANPWSPPAWMKANDALDNAGEAGQVLSSDYPVLAGYFVKFLLAYAAAGVPVSDLTAQNEPGVPALYPGALMSGDDETTFISQFLAPALRAAGLSPRIYGYDLNWNNPSYPSALETGAAGADLAGIAWHCYQGNPDAMGAFHAQFPGADEIVSECSPEILGFSSIELLISSLRNWASTVSVWNVALDPSGGPVEPPNSGCHGCTGLVTVNEVADSVRDNAKYFQIGQVSKFVAPGATRIASTSTVAYTNANPNGAFRPTPGVDDVAFVNPNGSKVLVATNTAATAQAFAVSFHAQSFTYELPAGATATFTWR